MQYKEKRDRDSKKGANDSSGCGSGLERTGHGDSLSGPTREDPTFEFDESPEPAKPLLRDDTSTETIDLASLFTTDLSTTGSFDIRGEIWTTTFGKVLQALPIPAFLIDSDYKVLQANQACSKICRTYNRTILGVPFSGLFAVSSHGKKVQSWLEDVFVTRKPRVGEAILDMGQRKIWARMTFRSLRIMDSRFTLALLEDLTNEKKQLQLNERLTRELEQRVAERTTTLMEANAQLQREINQRQLAEKALRENQERLKAVLEHLPDLLWMKDRNGSYLLVNEALARACGKKTSEAVIGKTDKDIWPKDVSERFMSNDRRVFTARQSQLIDELIVDKGMMKWFETFRTPMFNERGEIVGTVGSARNITERKRAEQALRDSEEKYRNILETIADGYHEVDLAGHLTLVNDSLCDITGYSREELLGRNYRELMDESNAQLAFDAYMEVYQTGGANTGFDCEIIRKDGTRRQVSVSVVLTRDSEENPTGFRGVFRDVTEHKQLEAQLQQAAKMEAIGRLAGGIAHDFNNLLTAVIGHSNILMQETAEDEVKRERLTKIIFAADRAATLTKQLLAFSRKQVLDVKLLNVNEVIAGMEDMLRRIIGENVELAAVCRSPLGRVRADPVQIEQILLNLAVNGRDAMPQGGKLTIETANVLLDQDYSRTQAEVEPGIYVMFSVSDTGVGMDQEIISHIFDPFFTTKEKGVGTGLGLSTVYGIVKQHQGHVVVDSDPGRGTVFKVYLPLIDEALATPETTAKDQAQLSGSETLLVVEDEEVVRNLMCEALTILGYLTLQASDPPQAIAVAGNYDGPIHLLISDVILPQMDGRSLYKKLSTSRTEMKVLYVSGYTENFIVHHGVLDQDVNFLAKPFAVETLAKKIRSVLNADS